MRVIERVLGGEYDNHIMPFLWMHGEEKRTIKEHLEKIAECGMRAVCLESRPYEEFLEDAWWSDLIFITEECERLGLEIWILDDKHFPTGYAAGAVSEKFPHLQKLFLNVRALDFAGPKKHAGILVKWLKSGRQNIMNVGSSEETLQSRNADSRYSEIVAVLAAKKTEYGRFDENTVVALPYEKGKEVLRWDIPEGEWTIFALTVTQEGGEATTEGYLNPLLKEASQVLIDTVYEPHYVHLKEKFGTVIKGFFSDEPRFGNVKGPNASIGRIEMPLPWRPGLETELAEKAGIGSSDIYKKLLLLFAGESEEAHELRYHYMDLVSRLYSENFSQVIGVWCEEHGVEYIGHVLEDNNAHARLGYGAGHFFRAMAGQHMSGIDVVLHQLLPRQNQHYFRSFTSTGWDGEFFTYGLAKLGASLGNLDPLKKGRTMCEVFGAYGWSEGLRTMKWITDHMLSRGVNYFVPHAFSMKTFPDADCPPHFYAHGHDLQFDSMKILNDYTNRTATLMSGGRHGGNTGILYHAEAEWAGEYMLFQKPARILTENQIEFDIVSADMLTGAAKLKRAGWYSIQEKEFRTLIVPYMQRISGELAERLIDFIEHGVKILFVGGIPEQVIGAGEDMGLLRVLERMSEAVSMEQLAHALPEETDRLSLTGESPYLRYYHYEREDGELFLLFNEDLYEDMETEIRFPARLPLSQYDPLSNQTKEAFQTEHGYKVTLAKGEMTIFYTGRQQRKSGEQKEDTFCELKGRSWSLRTGAGFGKPERECWEFDTLPDLDELTEFQDFSGELIYRTEFHADMPEDLTEREYVKLFLEIEDANEVVNIRLNGEDAGTRISYPYRFELSDFIKEGKNELEIRVTNSLGNYMKDYLSQFMFVEPLGIRGNIFIRKQEIKIAKSY